MLILLLTFVMEFLQVIEGPVPSSEFQSVNGSGMLFLNCCFASFVGLGFDFLCCLYSICGFDFFNRNFLLG